MIDIPVEEFTDVEKLTDLMHIDKLADLMTGLEVATSPKIPE